MITLPTTVHAVLSHPAVYLYDSLLYYWGARCIGRTSNMTHLAIHWLKNDIIDETFCRQVLKSAQGNKHEHMYFLIGVLHVEL